MVKIKENPIKMDDLVGFPLFLETPIYLSEVSKNFCDVKDFQHVVMDFTFFLFFLLLVVRRIVGWTLHGERVGQTNVACESL